MNARIPLRGVKRTKKEKKAKHRLLFETFAIMVYSKDAQGVTHHTHNPLGALRGAEGSAKLHGVVRQRRHLVGTLLDMCQSVKRDLLQRKKRPIL